MLETNLELALQDINRRLLGLIDQVNRGEEVDGDLLCELSMFSEKCFINYVAGHEVTLEELSYISEMIDLLEMRTTLIYKNPPKM